MRSASDVEPQQRHAPFGRQGVLASSGSDLATASSYGNVVIASLRSGVGHGFPAPAGSPILRLPTARVANVNDLSFKGFLLRAVLALLLVMLTFNPSGYSFVHMVAKDFPHITPVEAVFGILLLIGWIVFLGATLRSIGLLGMVLALALCAALVWLITSWGWVTLDDTSALTWIALVVLALIMAIGMAWAHLYRRWTGQATVDEVNEGQ